MIRASVNVQCFALHALHWEDPWWDTDFDWCLGCLAFESQWFFFGVVGVDIPKNPKALDCEWHRR